MNYRERFLFLPFAVNASRKSLSRKKPREKLHEKQMEIEHLKTSGLQDKALYDYLNVEDPDVFSNRAWELKYQREQEMRRNQPARAKKKSYDMEL